MVLWLDPPVLKALHAAFASASNPGLAHKEALIQVRRAFVGAHDMIEPRIYIIGMLFQRLRHQMLRNLRVVPNITIPLSRHRMTIYFA